MPINCQANCKLSIILFYKGAYYTSQLDVEYGIYSSWQHSIILRLVKDEGDESSSFVAASDIATAGHESSANLIHHLSGLRCPTVDGVSHPGSSLSTLSTMMTTKAMMTMVDLERTMSPLKTLAAPAMSHLLGTKAHPLMVPLMRVGSMQLIKAMWAPT